MNKTLLILGASLACLVGIGRGIGGITLVIENSDLNSVIAGISLIIVALWLLVSGITVMVKKSGNTRRWLTAGVILFWIGGIVNGFLLFGSPQLDGQVINLLLSLIILLCIWSDRLFRKRSEGC